MLWGMVAGKGRLLPGLLGFTGRCWDTGYALGGGLGSIILCPPPVNPDAQLSRGSQG